MLNPVNIENHPDLVRDLNSGAIVNTATEEYSRFMEKKNKEKSIINRIENLENSVNDIKVSVRNMNESFLELVQLIKAGKRLL